MLLSCINSHDCREQGIPSRCISLDESNPPIVRCIRRELQHELPTSLHSKRRMQRMCLRRQTRGHHFLPRLRHEGREDVVPDQLYARLGHLHRV